MSGSNDATVEFINLLDTNTIDIDRAPIVDFDYNGTDGHGGEDEVEEIDEGAYGQGQAEKSVRSKNYTMSEVQILIKAWTAVSLGAWTGTSQTAKRALLGIAKKYEKWELIEKESPPKKGSLTTMDDDEDDDGPRNLNNPDEDKKSREKIKREHEASSLRDKIDSMMQSNELMLMKTLEAKKELSEKKA
ncbi:putative galacturonosyltransferase 14 [Hordeum vulgare]|nr:putative galacturonosyltransferase 14 [Hordeum vulgare]